MSDILKTKKKLGIVRDNVVDYNVMYTMTGRIMNSMQYFLININFYHFFYNFSYFFIFFTNSLSLIH